MSPENARAELRNIMLTISEDAMSAQWYGDLEYILWDRIGRGASRLGGLVLTEVLFRKMLELSSLADGWFVYSDQAEKESGEGLIFVDLASWQDLYAAWLRRTPSSDRPRDR